MIEMIVKIAVSLVDYFLRKNATNEQAIKDYNAFNEIMTRKSLKSVQLRMNSVGQIERVQEMWKEEEKNSDESN